MEGSACSATYVRSAIGVLDYFCLFLEYCSLASTSFLSSNGYSIPYVLIVFELSRSWNCFSLQTDDLQDHIIICGFGRVGQVSILSVIQLSFSASKYSSHEPSFELQDVVLHTSRLILLPCCRS